jgi:hypothetical protein
MLGLSAVVWGLAILQGTLGNNGIQTGMGFLGLMGATMLASTALRLPSWARTRQRQMEEVAARIALATTTSPPRSD